MSNLTNGGMERFCVFPIQYPELWDFYQKQLSAFWVVEEIVLTDDISDWNDKLNDNERYFIKNILAFFAASDGIVNENLIMNFYNEITISEARNCYAVQIMMEAIHGQTYSLLIDTYIKDDEEKTKLLNAVDTIPAVKKKAEWALKWMDSGNAVVRDTPDDVLELIMKLRNTLTIDEADKQKLEFFTKKRPVFAQRLVAFLIVEGIFFSGSFCALFWLRSRGLMPGLTLSNSFISRDENLHAEVAVCIYNMINSDERLDEKTVHDIFKEAVEIENEFITESLPVSLLGMNCVLMSQYIKFVADRWLVKLGYNKLYNLENPFGFMELISVNGKTNFFESRNDNYSRPGVGQSEEDRTISFDCDDF